MSSDEKSLLSRGVPSPWPDGPNGQGLFEVVSFGVNHKSLEIDCALNHAALERLCEADQRDLADLLCAVRQDVLLALVRTK